MYKDGKRLVRMEGTEKSDGTEHRPPQIEEGAENEGTEAVEEIETPRKARERAPRKRPSPKQATARSTEHPEWRRKRCLRRGSQPRSFPVVNADDYIH